MSQRHRTPLLMEKQVQPNLARPKHGGDLQAFSEKTGISVQLCIDLSTGIAPWSWPVPKIPQEVWQALPSSTDYETLKEAAAGYYQCKPQTLLPIAGSQAGIEAIPLIAKPGAKVAYPFPGYEEHRFAWEKSGAEIISYGNGKELEQLIDSSAVNHAVVINPNNPSTEVFSFAQLERVRANLHARGGFLVVDEAFADTNPMSSCIGSAELQGIIILRSVGKFFGLAGLRLGFIAAESDLLRQLSEHTGLWNLSTPALWLGTKMLLDQAWIETQKADCKKVSEGMHDLVSQKFNLLKWRKTDLFLSGKGSNTKILEYREQLARAAIHSRYIPINQQTGLLRLGLANADGLKRIEDL